ncbi:MAG TPA: hypothetical protein VGN57_19265 [Pirellulaceae bacterium]|jgi:hypothetical protein|nr:hypothetical protein [Pirellulaceae bacterium]
MLPRNVLSILLALVTLSLLDPSLRADAPDADAAIELATRLHEAGEAGEFDEVAEIYRPEDLEAWKAHELKLWELLDATGESDFVARSFPGYSREEVAALDAPTAMKTMLATIRWKWLTEGRPSGGFRILGVVQEDDVTHVATMRYGKLELHPCYRTEGGELRMGPGEIKEGIRRQVLTIARLKKEGVPWDRIPERMKRSAVPVGATLLGIVSDGEEKLWLISRGRLRDESGSEYDVLDASPIPENVPFRELLDPDDPTKLDDDRRARLREALKRMDPGRWAAKEANYGSY